MKKEKREWDAPTITEIKRKEKRRRLLFETDPLFVQWESIIKLSICSQVNNVLLKEKRQYNDPLHQLCAYIRRSFNDVFKLLIDDFFFMLIND